ncbi:MAG: hypothetical protein LBM09_02220 [Candidatus Nomurabacteria bacterium]|jgi:hypothetical protein|nr:hypothetical protein [Candidatus Nomurabacteria bacterium]
MENNQLETTPRQVLAVRRVARGVGYLMVGLLAFIGFIFSLVGSMMLFTECTGGSHYSSKTTYVNGKEITEVECDGVAHDTKQFNPTSLPFVIIGLGLVVTAIILVIRMRKSRKRDDVDYDGVGDDLSPATDEQMALIENGMRELGQFYTPPKNRPNQMQARKTLMQIEERLKQNKRRV